MPPPAPAPDPRSGAWTNPPEGAWRKLKRLLKRFQLLRILHLYANRLKLQQRLVRLPVFLIFRALGLQTVKREELLDPAGSFHPREFRGEEIMTADEPLTLGEPSAQARKKLAPYRIPIVPPFIAEVRGALLAGRNAFGFTAGGRLILETLAPYFSDEHLGLRVSAGTLVASRLPAQDVERAECVFSLVHGWNNNYFHWLADGLARLEGLEFYEGETGRRPTLLVPARMTAWQRDALSAMGRPPESWTPWNGTRLRAETLVLSSSRREYTDGGYLRESIDGLRWVRDRALATFASDPPAKPHRIYVSRRRALGRRIVNEDALIASLVPLGFETHVLEELSFPEQVRLFAGAEWVIAPHGAGLTNILFSRQLKVIEIYGRFIQTSFAQLARGLGFRYGFLQFPAPRHDPRGWDADLIADIPAVHALVAKMGE